MLSVINTLKKHKIARSLLSVVLAIAVFASALSMVALIPAYAEYEIWDGTLTAPVKGIGSESDPYQISNGSELAYVIKNGGGAGKFYKLTKDIYLNDPDKVDWLTGTVDSGYALNTWYGDWQITPFQGTIDGNGHTVNGIYYEKEAHKVYTNFCGGVGLISKINGTVTIKNLAVDNSYIHQEASVSAFVAAVPADAVLNMDSCYAGANVYLKAGSAGALRGYAANGGGGLIANCYSLATLNGVNFSGLVAFNWERSVGTFTVKNCYNAKGAISTHGDTSYYATLENNYETAASGFSEGNTLLSDANMKGADVFSVATKMPNLNVEDKFVAVENAYPILKAFQKDDDNDGPAIEIWDGSTKTKPAQGNGSEATPYLVTNGAELAWAISNGVSGEFYKLTKDIYLNDISKINWETGAVNAGYTVRTWLSDSSFGANLDGDGYHVFGLYYNAGLTTSQMSEGWDYPVGLIPATANGTTVKISNLGIDYMYINAKCTASAFVGRAGDWAANDASKKSTIYIDQCYVGANVDVTAFSTGVFRGYSKNSAISVKNSYNLGKFRSNADKGAEEDNGTYDYRYSWLWANGWGLEVIAVENVYNATGALYKGSWVALNSKFVNCYAAGIVAGGEVWYSAAGNTPLTTTQMTGPDALTAANKMPLLNSTEVYEATDSYPALKIFLEKQNQGGNEPGGEETYGPEMPDGYTVWDGSSKTQPAEGTGAETDPYLISNGAELAWAVTNATAGVYYKLTNNIYLNDVSQINWTTGKVKDGYTVNTWLNSGSFGGNIDGDGFTVHGVYFNAGVTTAQMSQAFTDPVGLIPNVPNGVTVKISKLGVDNMFINAQYTASAFIGSVGDSSASDTNRATIYFDQCYVGQNVDVTAFSAAAFRGFSKNSAISIKNSYTLGTFRNNADTNIEDYFNTYNPANTWLVANAWDCDILAVENCYNAVGVLYKGNWGNMHSYFKNNYAAGGSFDNDNDGVYETVWYTESAGDKALTRTQMTGLDVFTDSGKMPQLNTTGVYKATEGFPMLSVFDKSVVAPTGPWGGVDDVTEPTQGTGTRRDPYLIGTAQELAYIIKNGGNDKYYKLTADIVLNDIDKVDWTTGAGIGGYVPQNWYDNAPFSGVIDGDGHVVYGLYYQTPNSSVTWGFYGEGLVPRVNLGKSVTISNLGVQNAYVAGQNGVSAFVGFAGANESASRAAVTINNCYVGDKVTLKGNDVGAFRGGVCNGDTTITNSYSLATLNGASTAGIVGNIWNANATINNVYNANGKITSENWLPYFSMADVYATDAGAYVDDVVALTPDNMQGPDALTSETKMPNLNSDGAFIAGDGFPTLAVFSASDDDDDTPVETPGQIWTGAIAKDFALGEGTEDDPFIIGTAAELAYAVKNAGFSGKYFKLSHDIYLNDISDKLWYFEDDCNAWLSDTVGFNGHLDGDGHIVYGMWYPEGASNLTAGLIPVFMTGSITNIGVRNAQANAIECAGGIVGKTVRSGYKYIDSCFVDETVNVSTNHTDYASGGIVGMAYDTTNGEEVTLFIQNCYSKARLSGVFEYRKNGILGGSWRTPYSIKNCYSIGYPVYTATSSAETTSAYWNYHPSGDEYDKNEARPGKKLSDYISNNYSDTPYVEGTKEIATVYTVVKDSDSLRGDAAKKSMAGLNYTDVYQTVNGGTPKLKIFTSIDGKDIVSSKDADFFGEGAGTQKDPFIVKTVAHLRYIVESIDTKGKYYKLGNDIYVNNTKNANWLNNNPVEWYTVEAGAVKFAGHFDGAGYKIYGLYKNDTPREYNGSGDEWVNIGTALFPYVDPEATIRNVHIRDSYLVGVGTVGGIAGNVMLGKESARLQFIACSVDESVTLKGFTVGGILGASHSRGVDLTYCYATAKMSNTGPANRLSGLVGDIWGAKISALECYTTDYKVTFGSLVNTTALYAPVEQFGVVVLDKNSMIGSAAKQNMDFSWDKIWYTEKGKTPQLKVVPYGAEESLYTTGKKGQVWSGKISTDFAGGDGTENNPYLIETPEQLARIFAVQSNEFTYYKLMADIKLNDTSKANWEDTAKMWYAGRYFFRGVFDGNGHVVSGLYYKNTNNDDNSWAGLFQGIGHSSEIKRLGVTQSKVINTGPNVHSYAAAICGYLEHWRDVGYEEAYAPVISECFADDSVYCEATAAAGILAGCQTTVVIENCYFTGELTGSTYAGAMIADNWAGAGKGPVLRGCYAATYDGDAIGTGYADKNFTDESIASGVAFMYDCYVAGATRSSAVKALSVMYMKGHAAKDYMPGLDFEKIWMTTESGTPVLRCFNNAEKYASTRNPKQVQISFGNLGEAVVEPIYGYPGYTPISADELPIPQRRGYVFNGWHHFNPDGAAFELELFPNYDITLYANWTEVGFTQNFDGEINEKYDYNEGIIVFKPGIAEYDTKYVHSGWRSLMTLKDSAVDPEFLVSYKDTLLVGYEYEITFWMAAGEDGTSGKLYFEQSNYGDVFDEIVGYQEALTFSDLKAGEWKQYTVKIVANAPYLIVRAEKGTTLFFEDFEAVPTGAKGELGNLIGYTPDSVGNEPGSNGMAPWLLIVIIGGAVLLLGGAAVTVVLLKKKKA